MFQKEEFIALLTESVGSEYAPQIATSLFDGSRAPAAIRVNPLKLDPQAAQALFADSARIPWSEHGYALSERPLFTLDPLFHGGAYYVQDSSSMAVGAMFRYLLDLYIDPQATEPQVVRVLDLCAAPGGKTTDLAASLREKCGDNFILVANEVVPSRAAVLRDNVTTWGDPNVYVTSLDSKVFGQGLKGYFDIILTDVPCSGEGMFRKEEDAVSGWSQEAVRMCANRSKGILENVLPALKQGGYLLYSTCTFNHFENDDNISYLIEEQHCTLVKPEARIVEQSLQTKYGELLAPGFVEGEGQYFAAVQKCAGDETGARTANCGSKIDKKLLERVLQKPEYFTLKGRDRIPTQALANLAEPFKAAALKSCGIEIRTFEADLPTALKFLRRENIILPSDYAKGYVSITYKGVTLGFVNNLINRTNNLYPKSRAIRMQIS